MTVLQACLPYCRGLERVIQHPKVDLEKDKQSLSPDEEDQIEPSESVVVEEQVTVINIVSQLLRIKNYLQN